MQQNKDVKSDRNNQSDQIRVNLFRNNFPISFKTFQSKIGIDRGIDPHCMVLHVKLNQLHWKGLTRAA